MKFLSKCLLISFFTTLSLTAHALTYSGGQWVGSCSSPPVTSDDLIIIAKPDENWVTLNISERSSETPLSIDWGDGSITYGSETSHEYADSENKTITISGQFDTSGNLTGQNLVEIKNWGKNIYSSDLTYLFREANFEKISATDTPNFSQVTSMYGMFSMTPKFNSEIKFGDTAQVTDMQEMFNGASLYNNGGKPLVLNTQSVTTMDSMFRDARSFNQEIQFNGNSLMFASGMFYDARAFNSKIVIENSINLQYITNMFKNAISFNKTFEFNTQSVIDMTSLFEGATSFNQVLNNSNPILLDTYSVQNMQRMFKNASSFTNGGTPLFLYTRNVGNMQGMFEGAASFGQDLSGWCTASVWNYGNFSSGSAGIIEPLWGTPNENIPGCF